MLRAIAKTCFACAYTWSGAGRFLPSRAGTREQAPFIICYHRVVENFNRSVTGTIPSMLISTSMLERHIDWLAKRFDVLPLEEIGFHLESQRPFRRPAAAITFDDGYSDVYHHAFPLLQRKGIPATVFVVTSLVGTGRPQIFDRLYLLLRLLYIHGRPLVRTVTSALVGMGIDAAVVKKVRTVEEEPFRVMTVLLNTLPQHEIDRALIALQTEVAFRQEMLDEVAPLSWDMIKTMHARGITIGSHTESHRLLPSETAETVSEELTKSKLALESELETPVRHFAYPDGRFNSAVVAAVKTAGYRFGYGICQARDRDLPMLTIPRKVLWERSCLNMLGRFSSSVMNCHVNGAFAAGGDCEHDHFTVREEAQKEIQYVSVA